MGSQSRSPWSSAGCAVWGPSPSPPLTATVPRAARPRRLGAGTGAAGRGQERARFIPRDRHPASPRSCSPSAPQLPVLLSVRLSVRQTGRAAASLRAVKVGVDARQPRRNCQALSLLAFPSLRPSLRGALLSRSPALPLFTPSGSAAALRRGAPDGTGQRDRAGRARTGTGGEKESGLGGCDHIRHELPWPRAGAQPRVGGSPSGPGLCRALRLPPGPAVSHPSVAERCRPRNDHGPGQEGLSSQVAVPGAGRRGRGWM